MDRFLYSATVYSKLKVHTFVHVVLLCPDIRRKDFDSAVSIRLLSGIFSNRFPYYTLKQGLPLLYWVSLRVQLFTALFIYPSDGRVSKTEAPPE
jgi:hypothetical protein